MNDILNCLESRLRWYQKAIHIETLQIPYENNFDFPSGDVEYWRGAEDELINTISMIKHSLGIK